ncbi:MAG: metallophosphoesterase [Alphaproteobacteria bacterium]|nr:metallophosphoesterase [Alphaproteobacteria bacterium]
MGRTLFVGDVHGCSHELNQLLELADPDRVVLVGDLFTKGPDPRGVWKLVKEWRCEAVLGNHDASVLKRWTPGEELPKKAFRWLASLPHLIREEGFIAVHAGVNPYAPKKTTREQAMFLRDWKDGKQRRPWWKLYRGRRLVVHGHHAREGLADRRPHVIGLDTNCVGGGWLSGYLLERDDVVAVRARRQYA